MSGAGRKGSYRKGVTDDIIFGMPVPEEGELVARVKAPRGGNIIEIVCDDGITEGLAVLPQKFRKLVWVKRGDYVIASGATKDIEVSSSSSSSGGGGNEKVSTANVAAVKYRIVTVLYKEQVRHIKAQGLWPPAFNDNDGGSSVQSAETAAPVVCDEFSRPAAVKTVAPPLPPSGGLLPAATTALSAEDVSGGAKAEDAMENTAIEMRASANSLNSADQVDGGRREKGEGSEDEASESSASEDDMSDLMENTNRRCYRATQPASSSEEEEEEEEED